MNNQPFRALSAELRDGDPLCRYVTIDRGALDFLFAQSGERSSQVAIAFELLQKARAELVRAWDENGLLPYQQTALRSIDECLADSRATVGFTVTLFFVQPFHDHHDRALCRSIKSREQRRATVWRHSCRPPRSRIRHMAPFLVI